ncbi:hypothetical protein NPIL_235311 [Nephila pilipes]|uniref:Uncharacterized protein n=1 Tax=Nephila pilipes TaxID=299642 RepID=A0A8X6J325_NEPPI|nr:hypothetical protein NPIL_235311 [Nephila pilipes]
MNKLGFAIILILVLNLTIYLAEANAFLKTLHMTGSSGELERADSNGKCRNEGESCDSARKCCPGFACNVLILGLGFAGSIRCGRGRSSP